MGACLQVISISRNGYGWSYNDEELLVFRFLRKGACEVDTGDNMLFSVFVSVAVDETSSEAKDCGHTLCPAFLQLSFSVSVSMVAAAVGERVYPSTAMRN